MSAPGTLPEAPELACRRVGWNLEVLQVEACNLLEGRSGDDAAPDRATRLVILVTVDEPQGAIFGGVVAAPAFQQIARFDLQYLEVPPDAPTTTAPAG